MAVVNKDTIRQDTYSKLRTLFVANKPTYTDPDSATQTYTISSTYSRDNPIFPLLVINPANVAMSTIVLDGGTQDYVINIQIDFYTKEIHGLKAIDAGRDSIMKTVRDDRVSLRDDDGLIFMEDLTDDTNVDVFDDNNQSINTASMVISFKLK